MVRKTGWKRVVCCAQMAWTGQAGQSGAVVSGQRVRFWKKNQSTAAAESPDRAMRRATAS